jgi:hypothetical protein
MVLLFVFLKKSGATIIRSDMYGTAI